MPGHIASLDILYTVQTADGPRHTRHHLYNMREHLAHDRVQEVIANLTGICEDLLAARDLADQCRPLPMRRPAS
jgi:hypothetical protein